MQALAWDVNAAVEMFLEASSGGGACANDDGVCILDDMHAVYLSLMACPVLGVYSWMPCGVEDSMLRL